MEDRPTPTERFARHREVELRRALFRAGFEGGDIEPIVDLAKDFATFKPEPYRGFQGWPFVMSLGTDEMRVDAVSLRVLE